MPSFRYFNLSITFIIIAFVIAIIQLIVYTQDKDNKCRSRKLNLGCGITSIVLCTLWLIAMIVLIVKDIPEGRSGLSII